MKPWKRRGEGWLAPFLIPAGLLETSLSGVRIFLPVTIHANTQPAKGYAVCEIVKRFLSASPLLSPEAFFVANPPRNAQAHSGNCLGGRTVVLILPRSNRHFANWARRATRKKFHSAPDAQALLGRRRQTFRGENTVTTSPSTITRKRRALIFSRWIRSCLQRPVLLGCGLALSLSLLNTTHSAADDPSIPNKLAAFYSEQLKKEPPLQPFRESGVTDSSVCKGAGSPSYTDTPFTSPMFHDLKGIYIFGDAETWDAKQNPLFSPPRLQQVAACRLSRQLAVVGTQDRTRIPIYTPPRKDMPIRFWPEAQEDDKLLIWVQVGNEKRIPYDTLAPNGIWMLRVRFFRHNVFTIDDLVHQCSLPFPYTDDRERLQHFLSSGLIYCLGHIVAK